MRNVIAIAVAALVLSAVPVQAAKSPTIKSVNKTAKKALAAAEDAQHDVTAFGKSQDKALAAQDDEIASANRTAQEANGRISGLPPTFKDNQVHTYVGHATITADTKGAGAATCPADQSVVSGGYSFNTNQGVDIPQPQITGELVQDNGWLVELNNVNRTGNVDLTVYAYCIPK
jgi:hypothetical protein